MEVTVSRAAATARPATRTAKISTSSAPSGTCSHLRRGGISSFEVSRYMGASLTMIARHYGHVARDDREHAMKLLDTFTGTDPVDVHAVDAASTSETPSVARSANETAG